MPDSIREGEPAVAVRFRLEGPEWAKANREILRAGSAGRWVARVLWALPVALAIPYAAAALFGHVAMAPHLARLATNELLLIGAVALFEGGTRILPRIVVRRVRDREEQRIISPSGLDVAGSLDAAYLPWSEIRRVKESRDFILFRGSRDTYFVPKRLLDQEQLARVRTLVRRNCPGEVKLLPESAANPYRRQ